MRALVACALLVIATTSFVAALPQCGASCTTNGDCVLSADGCSVCRNNVCTAQCGATCNTDKDCGLIPTSNLAGDITCPVCFFNQCGSQYCGAPCQSNSQCAVNPFCKECVSGACSPPPTPKPSVPPTPSPPTPPPTPPKNVTPAWGAIYCGGSTADCGDSSWYNYGKTLQEAETLASETCPTGNGSPVLLGYFTEPQPCAAMVLSGGFSPYFVASTDLGSAATTAISQCRADGHSTCFLMVNVCAQFPPKGARWGALATQGTPESLNSVTLKTNGGQGYASWEEASNAALTECNNNSGGGCALSAVWFNCMAFAATSGDDAAISFANSLSSAQSNAMISCNFESQGQGGCSVISSACIAPYTESQDHTVTGQVAHRNRK